MIVTSVIYLLEKHNLLHNSIPFTIVRSNLCPSRNRRISHTSARLWLSQAACTRRKRLDFAQFRSIYDCHILPVSVGKCRIMCISSMSRLSYYWEACVHRKITGFRTLWLYHYWYRRSCSLRSWNMIITLIMVSWCPAGPKILERQLITEGILVLRCDFLRLLPVICSEKCRFSLFRLELDFFLPSGIRSRPTPPPPLPSEDPDSARHSCQAE